MNITEIRFQNNFIQMKDFPNTPEFQERLLEYSKNFIYPIGMLSPSVVSLLREKAQTVDFDQVKNYLDKNISNILSQFYSTDEIHLIVLFILVLQIQNYFDNQSFILQLEDVVENFHTDKKELNYCLEEIKADLLRYYVQKNINQNKIDSLFSELELVEKEHNNLNIYGQK